MNLRLTLKPESLLVEHNLPLECEMVSLINY
jgi:hypothetical protein